MFFKALVNLLKDSRILENETPCNMLLQTSQDPTQNAMLHVGKQVASERSRVTGLAL